MKLGGPLTLLAAVAAVLSLTAHAGEPDVDPNVPPADGPSEPIPEPAPAEDESPRMKVGYTDARWGLGFDVGGGGLMGFTGELRVGRATWLDLGLHGRIAIIPGDDNDLTNALVTVGVTQELGQASTRSALFAVVGATPPGTYTDAFVAAGPAMRIWSPTRRVANTFAIGPGWLLYRDIPGAAPGPPFLIFLRYALHFHRPDSHFRDAPG